MIAGKLRWGFVVPALLLVVCVCLPAATKEQVIYDFQGGADGAVPYGPLAMDSFGNLYGTTYGGGGTGCNGGFGCGTVFELSPNGSGGWAKTILYSFQDNGQDGMGPFGNLAMDAAGNIYGATVIGGTGACSGGCGTVFELSPQQVGGWVETVLHSFQDNGQDGFSPQGGVALDGAGNLYGTTVGGGPNSCFNFTCGTVFELSPNGSGGWTETIPHSFQKLHGDGFRPFAGVIMDATGNLYGTTTAGAVDCYPYDQEGCGVVFRLSPQGDGTWTESLLYQFGGRDGFVPTGGLIFDAAGNLYGATSEGGTKCRITGCGVVFELRPRPHGQWSEKVIVSFPAYSGGGKYPSGSLVIDASGNLFGTTSEGGSGIGCHPTCGTAFELSPVTGGGLVRNDAS
jgi:hypothetical protein